METGADSQGFLHQAPFASSSSLRHFHDRPTDLGEPVLWGAFHNSLLLDARMHIIKSCFLLHNCGDKLQQLRQQASSVKICGVSAAPSVPPGCSRACVRACFSQMSTVSRILPSVKLKLLLPCIASRSKSACLSSSSRISAKHLSCLSISSLLKTRKDPSCRA